VRIQWEAWPPNRQLSDATLRRYLGKKRGGDLSHVILERGDGSYVQMLGGGVACCLEWRDTDRHAHYRAFLDPPKVPWREPSLLDRMLLMPGEHLFVEDVVEAFCAFLAGRPFPDQIHWRDVTEELVAAGIQCP
jgi:hypothetical protein